MSADELVRTQLRELLLDGVALPPEVDTELMFETTFASEPDAGADLLPPDGLLDAPPESVGYDGFEDNGYLIEDWADTEIPEDRSDIDEPIAVDHVASGPDMSAEPGGDSPDGATDLGDQGSAW